MITDDFWRLTFWYKFYRATWISHRCLREHVLLRLVRTFLEGPHHAKKSSLGCCRRVFSLHGTLIRVIQWTATHAEPVENIHQQSGNRIHQRKLGEHWGERCFWKQNRPVWCVCDRNTKEITEQESDTNTEDTSNCTGDRRDQGKWHWIMNDKKALSNKGIC